MREDRWVIPYLNRYWKTLLFAVVLGVVGFVFAAALMFTSGYMISLAATLPLTVLALHVPSIFVRIFGIGKPLIQYFEKLANHNWVLKMTSSLRVKLYKVLEKGSAGAAVEDGVSSRRRLGDFLGLLSEDIEHIQDLFLRTIFPLIVTLLLYLIAVIALGVFSWQMGLLLLVLVAQIVIVLPLVAIAINGAKLMRVHALTSDLNVKLTDDVLAIVDWRLSGRKTDLEKGIQALFDRIHVEERAVRSSMRTIRVIVQVLAAAFICLLLVWCAYAFSPVMQGDAFSTGAASMLGAFSPHDSYPYAANWIAAFVLCAFPLLEVFGQAPDAALGFVRQEASMQDLNVLDGGGNQRAVEHGATREIADGEVGSLALSDVRFSYADEPILQGIDLEISPGEKVAIMGRSGEGKSTLVKLISGELQPNEGSVAVFGNVCVIDQHPYIFRKSLRENLLLAKPQAEDGEILEALEQAGLKQFVSNLHDGLDTVLADGGINVSGGERQRIAVARALLADAPIVVLDEPFRGLDTTTERELQNTLFSVFADKTLVIVTHHMLGIENFDRVIFIEDSGIAADGSPMGLARENDKFRRLLAFDAEGLLNSSNS